LFPHSSFSSSSFIDVFFFGLIFLVLTLPLFINFLAFYSVVRQIRKKRANGNSNMPKAPDAKKKKCVLL